MSREPTSADGYPSRLVCMTEETTETLYELGEEWRIVGISGFTVRPPRARKAKPKVSAFTSAKIDRILALHPDLVLGFSDIQADIAAELIRAGVTVKVFNHRSVDGIFSMIRVLGGMIGCEAKTRAYVADLGAQIDALRSVERPLRPRVYFEEWDDPLISGIRWVSELIEIAGGDDCFPELAAESLAKARIIADHADRGRRRAGHHHWLLVWQEVSARARCGTARMVRNSCCARRSRLRGEVGCDLAARAGGIDRRCSRDRCDHRSLV